MKLNWAPVNIIPIGRKMKDNLYIIIHNDKRITLTTWMDEQARSHVPHQRAKTNRSKCVFMMNSFKRLISLDHYQTNYQCMYHKTWPIIHSPKIDVMNVSPCQIILSNRVCFFSLSSSSCFFSRLFFSLCSHSHNKLDHLISVFALILFYSIFKSHSMWP